MERYAHPARPAPVLAVWRGLEIPGTRATLPHGCPPFSAFTSTRVFTDEDLGDLVCACLFVDLKRRYVLARRYVLVQGHFPSRTVEDTAGARGWYVATYYLIIPIRGSSRQETKDTSQIKRALLMVPRLDTRDPSTSPRHYHQRGTGNDKQRKFHSSPCALS
ncbi:hypothetical protein C8R45DRAFT_1223632 [Mycena sanguinolenta]|nr:hypothetical protein C8R45DRAFT_1223632 [Mycena sanguinolenta]